MKKSGIKLIYLVLIVIVVCNSISAQKADSLKTKPVEIKDEFTLVKKRKYTYFISDRLSQDNKIDVFKVTSTPNPPGAIIVRGHAEIIGNADQKKIKIMVYNASNNELVGIYTTNKYTGNYVLVLVPNVKYIFKVEAPGLGTISEIVEVPLKIDYEVCKQDLVIKLNDKKKPILTLNSFFEDEDEKVYFLKSTVDTSVSGMASFGLIPKQKNFKKGAKPEKTISTVDELVKKQVIEENKKPIEALKAFNAGNFEESVNLYSAILKNDQQDPFANYYYGVSLFKLNKNIAKAINSLQIASSTKDVPNDVYLYLGKAYHLSYIFQDAIIALEEYKKRAKPTDIDKYNVPLLISNCKSGAELITEQINIEILKRTPIVEENILTTYNPEVIGDRLKYKTDAFKSIIDKKKAAKQLLCSIDRNEYVHVSYGDKEGNGMDLYKNKALPSGTISPSQNLGKEINTPYDENYPYIAKDGNTLYFSSKGHNSMGGYDIFKCTRPDNQSPWSAPINMGFPINSTYDDIMFIPDSLNNFAWMCSNRKNNRLEYIHMKLPKGNVENSVVKGVFSTADSVPQRDAIITVYNFSTKEIAGVYKTNTQTGKYLMILTAGNKYEMMIESSGYPEMSTIFEIPQKKGDFALKQVIKFQKDFDKKSLKVNNYFTESDAANVTLDLVAPTTSVVTTNIDNLKNSKAIKPFRTKDEAAKDKEDIELAKKLVEESNFNEALLIYQGLIQFINLDPLSLYNYGLCLYNTKKDKTDALKTFEIASANKATPHEVFYYLGKSNYLSYKFTEAIKAYTKFKGLAKPEEIVKFNIDKEIEYCNNCIKYVNNPVVMEVYEKKHVDMQAVQNSLTNIESGKILVISEDFRSSIDKKKNFKSLIYLTPDKNSILYTSYGENELNGKDIYRINKLGNGKWCPTPENLSAINTSLDEEYPCLSKDGKTLYFSSKSYDSMGGYDVYKSTWDEKMNTWTKPVNLGAPINSPYEDIYFLE
ncbi:MAG: hypothetical protein SFY56_13185 [Bacteroidota bacterium]|nr:hypothetical protein [Bacteroidota bacterium]